MPETRDSGVCACCDGAGKHPVANYLVPSYGATVPCRACDGTGHVPVEQAVAV